MAFLIDLDLHRAFALQPLTAAGGAPECGLPLPGAPAVFARIVFEKGRFVAETAGPGTTLTLNQRKVRRAELSEGDLLTLAGRRFRFTHFAALTEFPTEDRKTRLLDALCRLTEALMVERDPEKMFGILLDRILGVLEADKGVLLIAEGGEFRLRSIRNITGDTLSDCDILSRTVISRVSAGREPLLLPDDFADPGADVAQSLINLRIRAVAAAPMLTGGELRGIVYAGASAPGKLFDRSDLAVLTLFAGQAALLLGNAERLGRLEADNARLRSTLDDPIIFQSAAMENVLRLIRKVADSGLPVLLAGETGTGKELAARELHRQSSRRDHPFVAVNCSAIPHNLFESELFGHARGAFTGASTDRKGRFEEAEGGTLFLDEVGDLPPELQAKLLRALESREIEPLGVVGPRRVDVRVVSATNRNLKAEGFRDDLYFRLAGVEITLPPLRERGQDAVYIARKVLGRLAREKNRTLELTRAAEAALLAYSWPGNVRELRNRLLRAAALAAGNTITPELLELGDGAERPLLTLAEARERFTRDYLREALVLNRGNRTRAARDLDIDPRTIYRYLGGHEE